jgi:hypothetical protein
VAIHILNGWLFDFTRDYLRRASLVDKGLLVDVNFSLDLHG